MRPKIRITRFMIATALAMSAAAGTFWPASYFKCRWVSVHSSSYIIEFISSKGCAAIVLWNTPRNSPHLLPDSVSLCSTGPRNLRAPPFAEFTEQWNWHYGDNPVPSLAVGINSPAVMAYDERWINANASSYAFTAVPQLALRERGLVIPWFVMFGISLAALFGLLWKCIRVKRMPRGIGFPLGPEGER
ncbi:MAG TPA: hypothetical protein VFE47_23975 [Tepidisphaeraceae bacterium]|nr:hypothetical protein [Tepidisphaeraceae bacterium]